MSNGKSLGELREAFAAIFLGIVGGLALAAILSAIFTKRCPYCSQQIPKYRVLFPCLFQ